MRERVIAWLKVRPYVCGVLSASVVYLALTFPVGFTFMADDYSHLAAAWRLPDLFSGHFASWLSRVPVWSVLASALFSSHVFERTWAPIRRRQCSPRSRDRAVKNTTRETAALAPTAAVVPRWLEKHGAPGRT